jgi:Spy/CpxP family protein refolding chaperone
MKPNRSTERVKGTTVRKLYLVIGSIALLLAGGRVDTASAGPLFAGRGYGHGGMGEGPGPGALFPMVLRALDLSDAQKTQVAAIMARHRANVEPLMKQMRAAHDDLAGKLFGPGTVTAKDLAPGIEQIGKLKQQLLQEWTQAALETRGVLTADQLTKAAQVKQRLDALHAEMQGLVGSDAPGGGE